MPSCKVKLICVVCGKEYEKYPSKAKGSKCCCRQCAQKYASSCSPLTQKRGIYKKCIMCGNEYYRNQYAANDNNKKSKFCSRECKDKHHSLYNVGEKSNLYKNGNYQGYGANWTKQRKLVRERDVVCQICSGLGKRKLTIHHIRPFDTFDNYIEANNSENLIGLCESCHTIIHEEARKIGEKENTIHIIRQYRAKLSQK